MMSPLVDMKELEFIDEIIEIKENNDRLLKEKKYLLKSFKDGIEREKKLKEKIMLLIRENKKLKEIPFVPEEEREKNPYTLYGNGIWVDEDGNIVPSFIGKMGGR